MKRMTDLQLKSFQVVNSEKTELPLNDTEKNIMCNAGGRILLYSFGGVMMFSAAKGMIKLLATYHEYDVLILDVTNVPAVDFTSCKALSEMISDAKGMKREVLLAGTKTSAYAMLLKQGSLRLIPEQNRFVTREEALIKGSEFVKASGMIED
ncbi:MAG: STAS domain-containing protein [Gammaproteobacteria bacterium]|nr:STAS domain-containing protein [Gammaproteobacteria bacterium]